MGKKIWISKKVHPKVAEADAALQSAIARGLGTTVLTIRRQELEVAQMRYGSR